MDLEQWEEKQATKKRKAMDQAVGSDVSAISNGESSDTSDIGGVPSDVLAAVDDAIQSAVNGSEEVKVGESAARARIPKKNPKSDNLSKNDSKPILDKNGVAVNCAKHDEKPENAKKAKPAKKDKPAKTDDFGIDGEVLTGADLVPFQLPPNMTETGWNLPEHMSEDDWDRAGIHLKRAEGGVQWWYGDWWLRGKQQGWWVYGEGEAKAESLGIEYKTISNYASTCKAIPISRRRGNLTFTHHQELAPLKPKEQEKLLTKAEEENLSTRKLRAHIAKDRAVKKTRAVEFKAEELGQYAVVYADPPWRFENPPIGGSRAIEAHYPTMTYEELEKMEVPKIAAPDAILYMWTTNAHLLSAMALMQTWGFDYKSNIVWVKDKTGTGYYVRNQHELLLIGRKGDPGIPEASSRISSVLEAPAREHSRKPDEIYDIIDQMWPGVRKLELFARPDAEGVRPMWSMWGNQVPEGEGGDPSVPPSLSKEEN